MSQRTPVIAAVLAMLMLTVAPAGAEPPIERATDNVSLAAHVPYDMGSDMQFQRRTGTHVVSGEEVTDTRDLVFAGNHDTSSRSDGTIEVIDVTDPTDPVTLHSIPCPGYHADVAVWEHLLIHAVDSGSSNPGCDRTWLADHSNGENPFLLDPPGASGVRIFDVTDPADPQLLTFLDSRDGVKDVHNISVVGDEGLLYLAHAFIGTRSGVLGVVDLTDPSFGVTNIPMRQISPAAESECHDIGFDLERDLAFCPAITKTFIWDISDPYAPTTISTIVNPAISIHHGARLADDGTTLVLNDELAGAAFSPGCQGTGTNGAIGALWFYDISTPELPVLAGSFSPTEPDRTDTLCTSHFYNFIPGEDLVVTGWYRGGMIVTDFSDPSAPTEHAVFLPEGGDFWSAYYWHGYLYGNSTGGADSGGGLWVVSLDGVGDIDPAPQDEGTSWGRWSAG